MRTALPLLALMLATPALADDVVIYRCTGEDDAVTLQDFPCGAGQAQDERRFERPATPPAGRPSPGDAPMPATPGPDPDPEPAYAPEPEPLALVPALFQCRTFDDQDYFSEHGDGNRRCVPLEITRIGSGTLPGTASACEWVVDDCVALDPEAACVGWHRLHREAVRAEREAFSDTLADVREDLARLTAIRDSACAR